MTVSNIYNQPGSSSEYFTLANNTAAVLAANLGKCKLGVETDTNNLGYTDVNGTYHSLNTTTIRTISTSQNALTSDNVITCTATLTLSLYQATGSGRQLIIKNFASTQNTPCVITLTPYGSDKIDGNTTFVLDNIYDWIQLKDIGIGNWTITGWNASQHTHAIYSMGDSLTAGAQMDSTILTSLGNAWQIKDLGIGSSVTTDMLARFSSVTGPGDAEYVIIWGGINDAVSLVAYATIESNLQAMYTAAHNAGIKVIACTISPCSNFSGWSSSVQTIITTVNTWIKSTATNVDYVVDLYQVLGNGQTYLEQSPNNYDSGDGLHLSTLGYTAAGNAIYSGATWAFQKNTLYQIGLTNSINLDQNLRTSDNVKFQSISGSNGALYLEPLDGNSVVVGSEGYYSYLVTYSAYTAKLIVLPASGQEGIRAFAQGNTNAIYARCDSGVAVNAVSFSNIALQTAGSTNIDSPFSFNNSPTVSFAVPASFTMYAIKQLSFPAGVQGAVLAGGQISVLTNIS